MSNPKNEKISFKDGLTTYFKGVRTEWGKISWPQREQIIAETIIVLVVVAAFTLLVFLMDIVFKWVLGLIPH